MGHERYSRREDATGVRPVDELARRLFDRGGIDGIHIYSNVITIDLAKGGRRATAWPRSSRSCSSTTCPG